MMKERELNQQQPPKINRKRRKRRQKSSLSSAFHGLNDEDKDILFLKDRNGNFIIDPNTHEPVERVWNAVHLVLFDGQYDVSPSNIYQTILNTWTGFTSEYIHCELSFLSKYEDGRYETMRIACRIVAHIPLVKIVHEKDISSLGYTYRKITASESEIKEMLLFSLSQRDKPFGGFLIFKMAFPILPAWDFQSKRIEEELIEGETSHVALSAYTCTTLAACTLACMDRFKNLTDPDSGGVCGLYAWDLTPETLEKLLEMTGHLELATDLLLEEDLILDF